jgi:hypothetical protein
MRSLLLAIFACCTLTYLLNAEEPKPKPELIVSSAFWQVHRDRYFENIGVDVDKENGSLVLTELENFFLICRGDSGPLPGWKSNKDQSALFAKPLSIKYAGDMAFTNDVVSITVSKPDDEKRMTVTIEPPPGSTFTLKGKVELSVAHGDRIYLPTTTLRNNGKAQLFLAIWLDTGEEER